jgi:hypothetical protein
MKKHLLVQRLGLTAPLCGRQIARPGPGQQVAPEAVTADNTDVRCGWCLQKMADRGQQLTAQQWPLVAKKSVPGRGNGRGRGPEDEEEDDDGPLPDEEEEEDE